jgi:LacI family transcriptional regulator
VNTHVTLKDVALAAGVSTKTVSRVVNNQGEISEETRARVQAAIAELGYRPNILARSLVNQRSNTIAVVASGIEYYGPSHTILGIEQQADEYGYSLVLSLLTHPDEANVKHVFDELVARRVDGIIWAIPEIGDNRRWITAAQLAQLPPIVFLSMGMRPELSSVAVDNRAGARLAVQHLIERGRHRVGIVTGPLTWWEARERYQGWRDALKAAAMKPNATLVVNGDWSPASGERGMRALLGRSPRLDALFVSNDQMALGALGVLHRAGLRVPDDIALAGFDNIPEAAFFIPPLTTVDQPVIDVGRWSVQELHARIERNRSNRAGDGAGASDRAGAGPTARQLSPTLIARASTMVT